MRSVLWFSLILWTACPQASGLSFPKGKVAPAQQTAAGSREPQAATLDLEQALFVIQSSYRHDKLGKDAGTVRVQPGFLVEPGIGVTALSGLLRTEKSTLLWIATRKKSSFDVLDADPTLDLAVIRIRASQRQEPSPDDDTSGGPSSAAVLPWIAEDSGSTEILDPSHFVCWVDLVGRRDSQRIPLAALLDPSTETPRRMLPTQRAGSLSGYPIIDAEDRLAGLWQWSWAEQTAVAPKLVSAPEIRDLVNRAKSAPDENTLERLRTASLTSHSMPVLAWSSKEENNPRNAATRAKELRTKLRCPRCNGSGTYLDVDKDRSGRVLSKREEACTLCNRSRVVEASQRWEAIRSLAAGITQVPPSSDLEPVARELEVGLREALELNESAILHSAYDGSKEELAPGNLVPGRSIVCVLPREAWPSEDRSLWGERIRVVRDDSYPILLLRAPFARSTIGEGQAAWITAVVAGALTVDGEIVVVLDRAVVVPVPARSFRPGR